MTGNILTTQELLDLVVQKTNCWIEASLMLNNGFVATHCLLASGDKLLDEGIDSELREISILDFQQQYQDGTWRIEQIIKS